MRIVPLVRPGDPGRCAPPHGHSQGAFLAPAVPVPAPHATDAASEVKGATATKFTDADMWLVYDAVKDKEANDTYKKCLWEVPEVKEALIERAQAQPMWVEPGTTGRALEEQVYKLVARVDGVNPGPHLPEEAGEGS